MRKSLILSVLFSLLFIAKLCAQEVQKDLQENFLREFEEEYSTTSDPLYRYNYAIHRFNWNLYDYALNPLLTAYNKIMPFGYRLGIYNFFYNLSSPLRFVAHLIAFEPKKAIDEFGRFILNSFVGLLGFFDIASQNALYVHKTDFGIAFGKLGIGDGAYIVLPLLGPSNLRDFFAMPLNALANPISYLDPISLSVASAILRDINYVAHYKETFDTLRKGALGDDYILIRDTYLQHRQELINDNS